MDSWEVGKPVQIKNLNATGEWNNVEKEYYILNSISD